MTQQHPVIDPFGRHQLLARLRHRPLRLPLRLLHGGGHDVPAEGGDPDARRAGPAVQRLRPPGREEAAADRRRAAGAQEHHVPVPRAFAPSRERRAPGTDAHHQWQPAGAIRRGSRRLRRQARQCLRRYARSAEVRGHHALGQARQGAGRLGGRQGRRPRHQDQRGRAQGRQRGRDRRSDRLVRRARASTSRSSR